jgi:hypothetical protein
MKVWRREGTPCSPSPGAEEWRRDEVEDEVGELLQVEGGGSRQLELKRRMLPVRWARRKR